jgi:prepilin-type N-terminal cleavage/methylation domain-containing protein
MRDARQAFTLIELLTTLTVGSTLMILAVSMLHKTLQLSEVSRERAQRIQSSSLFADQFRRDVHAAISAECPNNLHLVLESPDHSIIEYTIGTNTIEREVRRGTGQLEREVLHLGKLGQGTFDIMKQPERVALTIGSKLTPTSDALRVDRHIEPIVGRSNHTAELINDSP